MYSFSTTVQLRIILTGRSIVDNSPDHFAAPDYLDETSSTGASPGQAALDAVEADPRRSTTA